MHRCTVIPGRSFFSRLETELFFPIMVSHPSEENPTMFFSGTLASVKILIISVYSLSAEAPSVTNSLFSSENICISNNRSGQIWIHYQRTTMQRLFNVPMSVDSSNEHAEFNLFQCL